MHIGSEKWRPCFMPPLTSIQVSFWNLESPKDEKVNFRFSQTVWKPHCVVKWDIFYFEVHSDVSTWTINQTALNIQFHNHVGIWIGCGIGKSVESVCVLSVESHCLPFYQVEGPLILHRLKSHSFDPKVSFSVEIFAVLEENGCSNVFRIEISATRFELWDIDILLGDSSFFRFQISPLSKKIDSRNIPDVI